MVNISLVVHELEKPLPRQVLAALDDAGHGPVGHAGLLQHAALALEAQRQLTRVHLGMAVPERGEAVGAIALGILVIAYAQGRAVQQPDDGGHHGVQLRPARLEVARHRPTDGGQVAAKGAHAVELDLLALFLPLRVVAVLLAAPGVAARGLQVALGIGADPDIHIGRWNGEFADARQCLGIAHGLAVLCHIGKALAAPHAAPAGHAVVHIGQGRAGAVCVRCPVPGWRGAQCTPCGGGGGGAMGGSE